MSEWNLSDKITRVSCKSQGAIAIECNKCGEVFGTPTQEIWTHPDKFIPSEDVREFIKRLKTLVLAWDSRWLRTSNKNGLFDEIDKLAGEKLC